jgi:hypothetical protein
MDQETRSAPSIKGTIFQGVVEEVRSLIARSGSELGELSRWLKPEDLDYLDTEILIVGWYDIDAYARMVTLLRDVEGSGSNEYLRQGGRRNARILLETGLYPQLQYLHRTKLAKASDQRARFIAYGDDLRILTSITAGILNFSCWKPMPDPAREHRYIIEVSGAQDFPEVLAWRTDGFINEMASQHGEPELWAWTRTAPDMIVFRMLRSL